MAHYIDAERLRIELEKRLKNTRDYMNGAGMKYKGPKYYKAQGKESAYDALLSVLYSLQQEQPEADLVKEVKRYYSENFEYLSSDNPTLSIVTNIARHFYELGRKAKEDK